MAITKYYKDDCGWDENVDGDCVTAYDYEELRKVAMSLWQWCAGHGKLFSKEEKTVIKEHELENY